MADDNRLKIGADVSLNTKNIESDFKRIGDLAKRALDFKGDPKLEQSLSESVKSATSLYTALQQSGGAIADNSARVKELYSLFAKIETTSNSILSSGAPMFSNELERANRALSMCAQLSDELQSSLAYPIERLKELMATSDNVSLRTASDFITMVNSIESSLKDMGVAVQESPTGASMLDDFMLQAQDLSTMVPGLSSDVSNLATDFFKLGENFQGEELTREFHLISNEASGLQVRYQDLVSKANELYATAQKALPKDEFAKFDAVMQKLGLDIQSTGDNLKLIPQLSANAFNESDVQKQILAYEGWISELQRVVDAHRNLKMTSEESRVYESGAAKEIQQQYQAAVGALEHLRSIQNTPPAGDVVISDENKESIQETKENLSALIQKLSKYKASMSAFNAGKLNLPDEEFVKLQHNIDETATRIENYKARLLDVNQAQDATGKSALTVRGFFAALGKSIRNVFTRPHKEIKEMPKSLDRVKTSASGAFNSPAMKKGLMTILKYGLGIRSLFFLFRRLRNGIKEGLNNLVQYNNGVNATNQAMTSLQSSLLYLKNAWGAAFAPIINAVMPILTALMDGLATVGNFIARFVASLTGQKKVLQAVKVGAQDYAKSLSGVGSSAGKAAKEQKKLNDRLADFDDLHVLGEDKDTGSSGSGGGGGGGGVSASKIDDMFEEVDVEEIDWGGMWQGIKDKIEAGYKKVFGERGLTGIFEDVFNGDVDPDLSKYGWVGNIADTVVGFSDTLASLLEGDTSVLDSWGPIGDMIKGLSEELLKLSDTSADWIEAIFPIEGVSQEEKDKLKFHQLVLLYLEDKDKFKEALEKSGKSWEDFIQGVKDDKGFSNSIKNEILELAGVLHKDLGSAIDEAKQKLYEMTADKVVLFKDKLLEIFGGEVPKTIEDFYAQVKKHPTEILNAYTEAFGKLPSSIGELKTTLGGVATAFNVITQASADGRADISKWDTVTKEEVKDVLENTRIESNTTASSVGNDIDATLQKYKDAGFITESQAAVTSAILKSTSDSTFRDVQSDAAAVGTGIAKVLTGVEEDASTTGSALKSDAKAPANGIIAIMNSVSTGFTNVMNNVGSTMSTLGKESATLMNGLGAGVSMGVTAFSKLKPVRVPYLAQGAVIPPNREFMAVLGDQSHGTNIEAPLDTIKQAVADVMETGNSQVVQLLQQLITVVESKNLTIGDKEIGKANARYINQQKLIRGTSI